MKIELNKVELCEIGLPEQIPEIPKSIFEERCNKAFSLANSDWFVVYGDREHFANIAFLTGFDPRFEEAILLLGKNCRVLLVGNEGLGYASVAKPDLDVILCQTLSLLGQDRSIAPRMSDILEETGIKAGQKVSVVGWKYLEDSECENASSCFFVPSMLIDTLRSIVNNGIVLDATRILMHPTEGLRAYNEAEQIAELEWGASRATAAVYQIQKNTDPGMTELQAVSSMNYCGEPLSMHIVFASGRNELNGLRSPSAKIIDMGDSIAVAVGFRGGLGCRAGSFEKENDDFLSKIAIPYFQGIAAWYQAIGIGVSGEEISDETLGVLGQGKLCPMLNTGHQGSLDEWLNSPFQKGFSGKLKSGMLLQCDIIPKPVGGYTVNCEDPVVLADTALRKELQEKYPEVWSRIEMRRDFMREKIGIQIKDEVLPLSSMPAYFAPLWLAPSKVLTIA